MCRPRRGSNQFLAHPAHLTSDVLNVQGPIGERHGLRSVPSKGLQVNLLPRHASVRPEEEAALGGDLEEPVLREVVVEGARGRLHRGDGPPGDEDVVQEAGGQDDGVVDRLHRLPRLRVAAEVEHAHEARGRREVAREAVQVESLAPDLRHRPHLRGHLQARVGVRHAGAQAHVHVEVLDVPLVVRVVRHDPDVVRMDLQRAIDVLKHGGLAVRICHGPVHKVPRAVGAGGDADVCKPLPGCVHAVEVPEQIRHHRQEEQGRLRGVGLLVPRHAHGVEGHREPRFVHSVGYEQPRLLHSIGYDRARGVGGLGVARHVRVDADVAVPVLQPRGVRPARVQRRAPGPLRAGGPEESATASAQLHGPARHPDAAGALNLEVRAGRGHRRQRDKQRQEGRRASHPSMGGGRAAAGWDGFGRPARAGAA
mmetsp:Transcript_27781/g.82925  ORF Transcript_27781/g.82925 Transcript_27781/m.82925 type:complete len:424 (-) Transcript_27781:4-1275(-)